MERERPLNLRGVHFGPGTNVIFDIPWWVQFLKSMGMGLVKLVDDAGSMMEFAAACRAAGIMPIIRLWRQFPYPGQLSPKDWLAIREYIRRGITRWFEIGNEPNLWDEWHPDYRPTPWQEGDPAVFDRPWFKETALPMMMRPWLLDSEQVIALGGYPAFPALAQCGFHPVSGSIPIARAMFDYLKQYYFERTKAIWLNGGWLAVHDATLNHFYHDGNTWHFEYPYDPNCQSRHPGMTIMDNDNSLIGHEAPRDMIWNRWGLRVPIISTEGGVFLDVGTQWDANYPGISSAEYHGEATLAMFNWLDEYQKSHLWFYGMCPWIVAGQVLGHSTDWEQESWKKVDREEPVVRCLQGSPPRDLSIPVPVPVPVPVPIPIPVPTPIPVPVPGPTPTPAGFPRPPKDNGMGIHFGLGYRLVGSALDEDKARAKAMRTTWGTVAFAAGEDVMLAAARALWAAGIMPVVRKVLNIDGGYAFGRDTRMLVEAGIPAYVQIFNEPSDNREWESEKKQLNCYGKAGEVATWCEWWAIAAKSVIAGGGYPGFQCLHPFELDTLFRVLPPTDPIWKRMWFCSHNYGLNHPPTWEGNEWGVMGFLLFAEKFQSYLGFVPPMICGEGGWLWKATDDSNYPKVDDALHAAYHKEMYEWFRKGKLSNGDPLPGYLFAVCPWILADASDEAWYGYTERIETINAVKSIPEFVRKGEAMPPIELKVYDAGGAEQSLQWAMNKYGVKLTQYEGSEKAWHVSQMWERVDAAAGVEMFFYSEDGLPAANLPVHFCWPGGCDDSKHTEDSGKVGWGYYKDAWIWDTAIGGLYWIEIPVSEPADKLAGLGMKAMTNHDHLDFVWSSGNLGGAVPVDPLSIILPLAEENLQAMPVPNEWAYPAAAIAAGYPVQVAKYGEVTIGEEAYGYQTFTREAQDEYIVAWSKKSDYAHVTVTMVPRD